MKHFFIIVAVIAASLCSCSNGSELVILAAEEGEYKKCREIFPEIECIRTGVDAFLNNAIRESGVLTSDEVWANVRQAVETILSRNSDRKR